MFLNVCLDLDRYRERRQSVDLSIHVHALLVHFGICIYRLAWDLLDLQLMKLSEEFHFDYKNVFIMHPQTLEPNVCRQAAMNSQNSRRLYISFNRALKSLSILVAKSLPHIAIRSKNRQSWIYYLDLSHNVAFEPFQHCFGSLLRSISSIKLLYHLPVRVFVCRPLPGKLKQAVLVVLPLCQF